MMKSASGSICNSNATLAFRIEESFFFLPLFFFFCRKVSGVDAGRLGLFFPPRAVSQTAATRSSFAREAASDDDNSDLRSATQPPSSPFTHRLECHANIWDPPRVVTPRLFNL